MSAFSNFILFAYNSCLMVYLEVSAKDGNKSSVIEQVKSQLNKPNSKTFMLIYMEGCGPCNATRPEWSKLKNVLSSDILDNPNVMILAIDKDVIDKIPNIKPEPSAFPTMRYVTKNGEEVENYEDANIETKDRTIDSFVEWIKSKNVQSGGKRKRRTRRTRIKRTKRRHYRSHRKPSKR